MQIFNRSGIYCDKPLWHEVAKKIGLGGTIKDAELVDRKMLIVVIHEAKPRVGEESFLYGESTLARIDLYPCRLCTFGTLTITFLHELAHVWMGHFHEDLSFEEWNEAFCEEFARRAFETLGGLHPSKECHLNQFEGHLEKVVGVVHLIEILFKRYQ